MSEVRGSGREYQTVTAQERQRGATPRLRSGWGGGAAKRRYPASEVRGGGGREEQPHDRGQGQWQGRPTPRPRSRGCAGAGGPRGAIPH